MRTGTISLYKHFSNSQADIYQAMLTSVFMALVYHSIGTGLNPTQGVQFILFNLRFENIIIVLKQLVFSSFSLLLLLVSHCQIQVLPLCFVGLLWSVPSLLHHRTISRDLTHLCQWPLWLVFYLNPTNCHNPLILLTAFSSAPLNNYFKHISTI